MPSCSRVAWPQPSILKKATQGGAGHSRHRRGREEKQRQSHAYYHMRKAAFKAWIPRSWAVWV